MTDFAHPTCEVIQIQVLWTTYQKDWTPNSVESDNFSFYPVNSANPVKKRFLECPLCEIDGFQSADIREIAESECQIFYRFPTV
jgi:hypothetical protein